MSNVLSHRPPEIIRDYTGRWGRRFTTKHRVVIEFDGTVSEQDLTSIKKLLPNPAFPRLSRLLWRAEARKGTLNSFVHVLIWGRGSQKVQREFIAVLQTHIIATRGGMA